MQVPQDSRRDTLEMRLVEKKPFCEIRSRIGHDLHQPLGSTVGYRIRVPLGFQEDQSSHHAGIQIQIPAKRGYDSSVFLDYSELVGIFGNSPLIRIRSVIGIRFRSEFFSHICVIFVIHFFQSWILSHDIVQPQLQSVSDFGNFGLGMGFSCEGSQTETSEDS